MSKEIEELQGEVKILKNEIKEILVGIKEYLVTAPQNVDGSSDDAPQVKASRRRSAPVDDGADEQIEERQSRNNHTEYVQMPPPVQQAQNGMQMPAWAQQAPGGSPPQWWPQPQMNAGAPPPLAMPPVAQQVAPPQANGMVQVMDKPVTEVKPLEQPKPIEQPQLAAELEPMRTAQAFREPDHVATTTARHREQETVDTNSSVKSGMKPQARESVRQDVDRREEPAKPTRKVIYESESKAGKNADSEAVLAAMLEASGCSEPQEEEPVTFTSVALLAPWVECNLRKLGKEKLKSIVRLYADMGQIKNAQRDLVLRLIGLEGEVMPAGKATLRESMRALAELDNLMAMSKKDQKGAAILSMYLNGHRED